MIASVPQPLRSLRWVARPAAFLVAILLAAPAVQALDFEKLIGNELRKRLEDRGDSGKSGKSSSSASKDKKRSSSRSSSRGDHGDDKDRRKRECPDAGRSEREERFERFHYAPLSGGYVRGVPEPYHGGFAAPYPVLPCPERIASPVYNSGRNQYLEDLRYVQPGVADPDGAATLRAGTVEALVQERLAQMGYYRGAIDGRIGPESRAAILQYRIERGLPVKEGIDWDLLYSLGLIADLR